MRGFGFKAMKGFMALASAGWSREHADPLTVVTVWSTVATVAVIVVYCLQRGH